MSKKYKKAILDAILTILMIAAMFIQYTGTFLHEIIGFAFFVVVVAHLVLSASWIKSGAAAIGKRKASSRTVLLMIIGSVLAVAMVVLLAFLLAANQALGPRVALVGMHMANQLLLPAGQLRRPGKAVVRVLVLFVFLQAADQCSADGSVAAVIVHMAGLFQAADQVSAHGAIAAFRMDVAIRFLQSAAQDRFRVPAAGVVHMGRDLRQLSLGRLTQEFGKMGRVFYDFARGIDHRPVISEWERKSVSCEQTFETDLSRDADVALHLYHTVVELVRRIEKNDFEGRTLTLKVKFLDFQQITRSITADHVLRTKDEILPLASQLMEGVEFHSHPIRLLGLGVSHPGSTPSAAIASHRQWIELELEFEPWPEDSNRI